MSTIATLLVNVAANTSQFEAGLKKAQGQLSGFASFLGKSGLAGGAAAAGSMAFRKMTEVAGKAMETIQSQAEAIDSLGKSADRVGATTEEMATLEHMSKLAGVSIEEVEQALTKMNRQLNEARGGGKQAEQAFAQLGLTADQLAGVGTSGAFWLIGDSINALGNAYDQTASAQEIFGRGGAKMLTLLRAGSAGFRDAAAEAKKFGLTFSKKDFAAVEAANDQMTKVRMALEGATRQLVIAAAPTVEAGAATFTQQLQGMAGGADMLQTHIENLTYSFLVLNDNFLANTLEMERQWHIFTAAIIGGLAMVQQSILHADPTHQIGDTWLGQLAGGEAFRRGEMDRQIAAFEASGGWAGRYEQMMRDLEKRNREAAAATREHTKELQRQQEALAEAAKFQKVLDAATVRPFDKFNKDLQENVLPLMEMFNRGKLGLANLGRAFEGPLNRLRAMMGGMGETRLPGLAMQGSREAFQARTAFERQGQVNQEQEIQNLLKKALEGDGQRNRHLENIANILLKMWNAEEGAIVLR